jgi:DNA-binding response OmpR family regulator
MSGDTEIIEKSAWREAMRVVQDTIEKLLERERARTRPARVLIVDDNPDDVCFLCRDLNHFMVDVDVCHDSVEATRMVELKKYDFVFLDQKMPKFSGLDILRKTTPGCSETQFFIVSGFPDSKIAGEALQLGALFVPKPLTDEERQRFRRLLSTFLKPRHA